jgi:hypothetical protein
VEKMNKITKKLQKLVENRKEKIVVSDQKSYNPYKAKKTSSSSSEYYSSGYNT